MADPNEMTLHAWAKINLGLAITAKRSDGYHDIATVFHRIAWHDELHVRAAAGIEVESTDPGAPGGDDNLCAKAARLLRETAGIDAGVHCRLEKYIPVGAGLGGGSSDAAAVLRTLPRLWNIRIDDTTLSTVGLRVGSDVPYFLGTGSAFATGRGERLEYFDLDIPYAILVCHPGIHISTPWAYGQIKPRGTPPPDLRRLVTEGMIDPELLTKRMVNDFEGVVFSAYPAVAGIKETMLGGGAVYASLSGSGSAVFGFFEHDADARTIASNFIDRGYRTSITPPHFRP